MGFNCGIVGLPNVGKSTIFNALTQAGAEAANYPFCTIEPNKGIVAVGDERIVKLAAIAKSQKIIPAAIEFVDIAGLVKGASKGEGLGNQFLGHIRSVDAILQVVRCFEDENVTHVEGSISPVRDIQVIETELLLADLESVDKRIDKVAKLAKSGDKEKKALLEKLEYAKSYLDQGINLRSIKDKDFDLTELQLLTAKPLLYVANVLEDDVAFDIATDTPDEHLGALLEYAKSQHTDVVIISGKVEEEVSQLPEEDRIGFLEALGLKESGLTRLATNGYKLLNLITFFTIGPKEAHAWTCQMNDSAPVSAGKIHTDFQKGFIRAEVIAYDDFVQFGGESGARDKGKLRVEGKEYIVQDGDIMHFRFNV